MDIGLRVGVNNLVLSGESLNFSGKLKTVKVKNDKNSTKEEQQDEKIGAVDQIKKKYGFATPNVSIFYMFMISVLQGMEKLMLFKYRISTRSISLCS